jgi:hypothetical protein
MPLQIGTLLLPDHSGILGPEELEPDLLRALGEAKSKWPNVFLLKLRLPPSYLGDPEPFHVLIRPMTRAEAEAFHGLKRAGTSFGREYLLKGCFLYPADFIDRGELPAGYVESACDIIEEISAWGDLKDLQQLQNFGRGRIGGGESYNVPSLLDMLLGTVFKGLRPPTDTMNMDAFQSMEMLAMSEKILGKDMPINPQKVPVRHAPLKEANDDLSRSKPRPNKK